MHLNITASNTKYIKHLNTLYIVVKKTWRNLSIQNVKLELIKKTSHTT